MAWREIAEADVIGVMIPAETNAYNRAGLEEADPNRLLEIIQTAVDEARGRIEDCNENQLGAAGTIPDRVRHNVLAMIRYRLIASLPGIQVSNARTKEFDNALSFLKEVGACKVKIEQPETADVVKESNVPEMEVVNQTTRQATRSTLRGL